MIQFNGRVLDSGLRGRCLSLHSPLDRRYCLRRLDQTTIVAAEAEAPSASACWHSSWKFGESFGANPNS